MENMATRLAKFFGHIEIEGTEALLYHGLRAVLILAAAFWLVQVTRRAINRNLAQSGAQESDQLRAYRRIATLCILVPAVMIAIHVLGIDLTPFFATSGIVALALGFGMRNFAENFISGVIIRVDKFAPPGAVLDLEGDEMTVRSVGLRSTTMDAYGGRDILIPNSDLLQSRIGTFTHDDTHVRITVHVRVGLGEDPTRAKAVLRGVVEMFDWCSDGPEGSVNLSRIADGAIEFSVSAWVDRPGNSAAGRDALNRAIWTALDDAQIEFALPGRAIYFQQGALALIPET